MAMNTGDLARQLEDLIAALDRRVPRVEQAGEVTIAREAAALRVAELGEVDVAPAVRRSGDRA